MIQSILNNPLYRFLLKAVLFYMGYYLIYELWLHPLGFIDLAIIRNLETISSFILEALGFTLISESHVETVRTIGIDGTNGLWIGDPCNGLTLFVLFSGFVVAFPGPWKKKLWFIPLGLVTIHLINVLRIMALALIVYFFPNPEVLDFNHTYTFTLLVYSYVLFLWYVWANKLSGIESLKVKDE